MRYLIKRALMLAATMAAMVAAGEISVNHAGAGISVLHFEEIPYVNAVHSDVPVQVLRYSDMPKYFVEGEQALFSSQRFVVVKSTCGDDATLLPQIDVWRSIVNVTFPDAALEEMDTETFLEASVFDSSWSYTSFFCASAPAVSSTSRRCFVIKPLNWILALLSLFLVVELDDLRGDFRFKTSRFMVGVVVVLALSLVPTMTIAESYQNNAKTTTNTGDHATAVTEPMSQKLAQCPVTVEILMDGCLQSDGPDLIVQAPAVRVMDGRVEERSSNSSFSDVCTRDYTARLVFSESVSSKNTIEGRQQDGFPVGSFGPEAPQRAFCNRIFEGRPYVDTNGRQIHATAGTAAQVAWSAAKTQGDVAASNEDARDDMLGQEWLDRAVGEHASVAAFASFTLALMSNNAPPELVQDALSAAQDEVRHAKTSFEVASLLLGETMEPGPLPPSTFSFGEDIVALAVAAAKEGCVEETLSALVAGVHVDYEIDRNPRISAAMKAMLKDKMLTIALEETNHSRLAWRTVQWACSVNEDACEAVRREVFHRDYFDEAFARRFAHHSDGSMVQIAKQVWEDIHTALTPIALGGEAYIPATRVAVASADLPALDCLREEEAMNIGSVLELMGRRITSHLTCSLQDA